MGKIWNIVKNLKRVVALIDLIKKSYEDKKITDAEAKSVLIEAVDILAEMGVVEKEA